MLTGCGVSKYSSSCDFNPMTHSYSYKEISDSTILSKRTQIILKNDSTLYGSISGITSDNLIINSNLTNESISIPLLNIRSFSVSGFPKPYYNRVSFGFGFAGTFILLTLPYIISTYNSQTPVSFEQTPELTLSYWVAGILSGFLLSNQLEYSKEEMQNQIVTIYVK